MKAPRAKTTKSGPPVPMEFSPHDWVPLNKALAQIMAHVGDDPALAADQLDQDLRSRRLESALRSPHRTWRLLKPSDWRQWAPLHWEYGYTLTTGLGTIVIKVVDKDNKAVDGHFFVRRTSLNEHYPTAVTPTAVQQSDDTKPPTTSDHRADDMRPPTRRPGPPPELKWRTFVAREIIRRLRTGEPMPTAPQMLQLCGEQFGSEPGLRQMQEYLRALGV